METPEKFRARLAELVASQRLAVLSTHSDGQPYASLIAVAATEDLETYLFTTPRASRKFANLQRNPAVALLLENASNRPADFQHAMAVTITGKAETVSANEFDRFDAIFLARHPELKSFVQAETTARIRVAAESFYLVRHFQEVMTYHLNR
ncbi:MAG: pyridoxamine 5'-phosphate oxidase family protein [Desulfobacterales bacterium]|nr:pyridoxamine 5'-phosphate oxidase family protein [Desulfobacterales bacterium]